MRRVLRLVLVPALLTAASARAQAGPAALEGAWSRVQSFGPNTPWHSTQPGHRMFVDGYYSWISIQTPVGAPRPPLPDSTGTTRAIPTLINVSAEGKDAIVQMTVKTEKGQIAKADAMRPYMCTLFAKLKGGKEGRAAAAQGAKTQNNADVTVKDVFIFSREIAREAKGNAVAVTARHKGRNYALRGRVDYVQEDGEDYNVSFEIPDQSKMLIQVPGLERPAMIEFRARVPEEATLSNASLMENGR